MTRQTAQEWGEALARGMEDAWAKMHGHGDPLTRRLTALRATGAAADTQRDLITNLAMMLLTYADVVPQEGDLRVACIVEPDPVAPEVSEAVSLKVTRAGRWVGTLTVYRPRYDRPQEALSVGARLVLPPAPVPQV